MQALHFEEYIFFISALPHPYVYWTPRTSDIAVDQLPRLTE